MPRRVGFAILRALATIATFPACASSSPSGASNADASVHAPMDGATVAPDARCPDGGSLCGIMCVDTERDPMNCGGCGGFCGGQCDGGQCPCVAGRCACTVDGDCLAMGSMAVCVTGLCACPAGARLCGNTCVDPMTDPNNCGGCGVACDPTVKTCKGGSCACLDGDSACNLTALATGLNSPQSLAIDGTYAYFAVAGDSQSNYANGAVMKVALAGGAPPVVLAGNQTRPGSVAVDTTSVYWTTFTSFSATTGSVMKVGLDGGAPFTLASGQNHPQGTAVVAGNVYWLVLNSSNTGLVVMTVPASGGTPQPLVPTVATDFVVDANNVYWTAPLLTDAGGAGISDQEILKMPLDGGPQTVLASGVAGASSMAVDSANLYWLSIAVPPSSPLMAVPVDGGSPLTLASFQTVISTNGQFNAIATDGANVYVTLAAPTVTSMVRVPIGGGAVTTLAAQQNNPGGVAVDGTSVYWAVTGGAMNAPGGNVGAIIKLTPK